jgi:hypothetical protein
MSRHDHIDDILRSWPHDPEAVNVRIVKGDDGRSVLQMRLDMGLLQMELTGRPDGRRPEGYESYLDYLVGVSLQGGDNFELDEDQCAEIDREFVQYYHRRVSWLRLQEYDRAVQDADHTLCLMNFCRDHSPDEHWTMSHEQYRPFVLFHRTQAAALEALQDDDAEAAIHEINQGLDQLRDVFEEHGVEEHFEEDELVERLNELRESLRDEYNVGKTIHERLAQAVAEEEYELAAKLRDELARRQTKPN